MYGLDDVGLRTVEQLYLAGVKVVVVEDDADPRLVRVVRGWGVPVVIGSPRLVETLDEAEPGRSRRSHLRARRRPAHDRSGVVDEREPA
nr:hypothetical protein GCM10020092_094360 [Actinoplanes digitatis]